MPTETTVRTERRLLQRRYRGRIGQIRIYLVKMLRMFLYQNDWMVLPMAALVAGLVGIVIRRWLFQTMEGTLLSALAVTCVCLWNGCFNSIQVICRERDVIKREHRSGMHVTSYIAAHMIYQALLCLLQTGITIYVLVTLGVRFPKSGFLMGSFLPEFGVSLFLITYAADMMALLISALCRSTTAAMTVMPVVLIFQLVCSGGMMSLPEQLEPYTGYIISNVGLKLVAAEADYNNLQMVSIWNTLAGMRGSRFSGSITLGDAADKLQDANNPSVRRLREIELVNDPMIGELTLGGLADAMAADNPDAATLREKEIPYDFTVGDVLHFIGEEKVRDYLLDTASQAAQKPEYASDVVTIAAYWVDLMLFALAFALCAVISLEFIDRDKR